MPLLVVARVTKRHRVGRRDIVALRNVSFDLAAGELVAVFGLRRIERVALLRVVAGIDRADDGAVAFDGRDVWRDRSELLGREVALCSVDFSIAAGSPLVDHVAVPARLRGASRTDARLAAHDALDRVGMSDLSSEEPRYLAGGDLARAMIARALVNRPRLMLLDDPTHEVELAERDAILALIRSLAGDGIACLATTPQIFAGASRTLSLSDGALAGDTTPTDATVHELRLARRSEPAG